MPTHSHRHPTHLLPQLMPDLRCTCRELRTNRLPQRSSDLAGSLVDSRSVCASGTLRSAYNGCRVL